MDRVRLLLVIWMGYFIHIARGIYTSCPKRDLKTKFIKGSVPLECEDLDFCENFDEYPEELARNLIKELQAANATMDSDHYEGEFASRFGDDKRNPCPFKSKIIKPSMVRGYIDGNWYYAVNSKVNPIQTYKTKKCITQGNSVTGGNMECAKQLILKDQYKSQCIQKFMTRRIYVVMNDTAVPILVQIPSCCTCVAVNNVYCNT